MELTIDENVLNAYSLTSKNIKLQQIGSGHINRTYLLTNLQNGEKFVLQSINTNIFPEPTTIANNIKRVASYLNLNFPDYLFPAPLKTISGEEMAIYNDQYWRLTPFMENTVALDALTSPKQAYEAAKQFGKLSRLLDGFDSTRLKPAIVGFHDLELRFDQFQSALSNSKIKAQAITEIDKALQYKNILTQYREFNSKADFPDRVMHHDTKISNVLLDKDTFEGVCVIDLDTLMPGKFISDLGDMMRTYLCEFSENETDLSKIEIRIEYFSAMIEGYLAEMGDILTYTEKEMILFSGQYIVYMQALRFLTDFLNGSVYYPINYTTQNLDRARNQFKLLDELIKNEQQLQQLVDANLVRKQL
ncbi:MAG: aminoglycoside phosphotransferase family protein [Pedobacter sp.]|uniref:phosphotransferase enzyme family protein n=1 Tax=Pedobacter sp. TaxID=1411316 RepID=UPI0028065F05|nr:aminoglycoside phosphotransferase family protein [Pedobacter sp.]MDQ8006684.1 aminoglycoside phosphotransferase family protein [Pedobacter sp.]